tara:strand:+ start:641 stop:1519 length:879 start_codon:yes stop_codon:yes gene_type:complete
MEVIAQVIASGLTLGAMYGVAAVGLALVWGAFGMLNLAHGAILTFGGYAAYFVITTLGFPMYLGLAAAIGTGALLGILIYWGLVRGMLDTPAFETNIFIATFGIGMALENLVLKLFGAYPAAQPLTVHGTLEIVNIHVPYRNLLILVLAVVLMVLTALLLSRTDAGRAIRATAQNRSAAELMGVGIFRIYMLVLGLSGALAGISGIMVSSLTNLAPTMGNDPMLKAFIVCVVAGLGNVYGAMIAAILLGLVESAAQFIFGVRFGFATLLLLVIMVLIWRPYGLFGRSQVQRQ